MIMTASPQPPQLHSALGYGFLYSTMVPGQSQPLSTSKGQPLLTSPLAPRLAAPRPSPLCLPHSPPHPHPTVPRAAHSI